METEELGYTVPLHRPVLCNLQLPISLLSFHWGWDHVCSLETEQVGKKNLTGWKSYVKRKKKAGRGGARL